MLFGEEKLPAVIATIAAPAVVMAATSTPHTPIVPKLTNYWVTTLPVAKPAPTSSPTSANPILMVLILNLFLEGASRYFRTFTSGSSSSAFARAKP